MTAIDPFDARRALAADGLLRAFNDAGVLAAADVHVARCLCALAGESDETVALAAALAVRGPRLGHVLVDLATVRETAIAGEGDEPGPATVGALSWPDAPEWLDAVRRSPLVAVGDGAAARDADGRLVGSGGDGDRPLRLAGTALYLDRLWRDERGLAADLLALRDRPAAAVDEAVLGDGLDRLLRDEAQRRAAETAVRRRLAVVAGGPGTGKTTTVARILALLLEQPGPAPLAGLAAPTGKAAARLTEAIHEAAPGLDTTAAVREQLLGLEAVTLHRLLGRRPGSHSRFRHDRHNRLPHDVVIVDETSMVSLPLMARLVEAVRPEARLVLVGDPGQLASIEAGAVFGDVVQPGEGVVVLETPYRFGGEIDRLAEAIRRGDGDATVDALGAVTWIRDEDDLEPLREAATTSLAAVVEAARAGAAPEALRALGAFRLLCAHRRGPHGVGAWTARLEAWLADALPGFAPDGDLYAGRPLLVTANDYGLGLFNGDTGVIVAQDGDAPVAAFERRDGLTLIGPSRLASVETVFAMTVHKAQGSQFGTAAVVLPEPDSPLLTRELLYTAVTRARERLMLVGGEEAVRAAVARPVARASGLRERLWGSASVSPPR